jgi:hypothetical protein
MAGIMNQDAVNDHTIFVYALRRSGHHAVIQWILNNARKPVCFLNDCDPCTNPYLTAGSDSVFESIDLAAEGRGNFSRKALLVCSYEDKYLARTFSGGRSDAMADWIGPSTRSTHLLILRDPFNLIASKYRMIFHGHGTKENFEAFTRLPELWKSYARAFLRAASNPNSPLTPASYNHWFTDDAYRRTLAIALGLSTGDEGRNQVARWGPNLWGDSFDGLTFDGRATEMKVLERWKNYATDPFFRLLVRDKELIDLSMQIFGPLPGYESLIA